MDNGQVTGWDMVAFMGTKAVQRLELISQNLANSSTFGFKQELLDTWRLDAEPQGQTINLPRERLPNPGTGIYPENSYYLDVLKRDYSQGPLINTGDETDVAIYGPGFFKIQTPRGVRYTRDGSFQLDKDYKLVTRQGYPVLGKGGPLILDATDKKFSIDSEGGIHLDQSLRDQIAIVDFANIQGLIREKGNLFASSPDSGMEKEAQGYRVQQGVIEESNVNPIIGMIQLMDNMRNFEAYLKVLENFQSRDVKMTKEVGNL